MLVQQYSIWAQGKEAKQCAMRCGSKNRQHAPNHLAGVGIQQQPAGAGEQARSGSRRMRWSARLGGDPVAMGSGSTPNIAGGRAGCLNLARRWPPHNPPFHPLPPPSPPIGPTNQREGARAPPPSITPTPTQSEPACSACRRPVLLSGAGGAGGAVHLRTLD